LNSLDINPDTVIFRSGSNVVRAEYFAGETLLDTARRVGLSIATSCELGNCGTCMVELLKGKVEMRNNNALTEADLASGCVLACQSVPVSERCEVELS